MTTPAPATQQDGVAAQLLLKISNDVTGLVTDMAVIKEQTRAISDHEARLRALEATSQQSAGGRDTHARYVSWLAAAAAVGSGIASYLHH